MLAVTECEVTEVDRTLERAQCGLVLAENGSPPLPVVGGALNPDLRVAKRASMRSCGRWVVPLSLTWKAADNKEQRS